MGKSVKTRIIQDIARKRIKKWLSSGYLVFELSMWVYAVKWNKLLAWILGVY